MQAIQRAAAVAAVHLVCVGVILLGSRIAFMRKSIRLDEAQSLWQTDHSYGPLLGIVARDVHVPLYHVVLRTWRLIFGFDIETARELSLVFLLASVPFFYLVARRGLSRPWALLAVLLFSCSPFLQWYGNEARMYTMLVLVTLISQYSFLGLLQSGRNRWWVGYAASAVVGIYVHYFFVFVLLTQGLVLLALWRRLPVGVFVRLGAVALVVTASFSPWLLFFRANGSASGTRPNLPSPSSVDYSNVYSQFLFGFQSNAINTFLVSLWPVLVLAGLASVRVGGRLDRVTGYLVAAAVGPVLMAFVLSHLVSPFFLSRYMIAAVPAVLLLVVRFIGGLSAPVARALAAGVLAVTVVGTLVETANPETPVNEDYRSAARLVGNGAQPQDLVVLASPFTVYPFDYYYQGSARVTTLPAWDRQGPIPAFDGKRLSEDVSSLIEGHKYIYLLLSYDQGYESDVFQYFERHFERTQSYNPSPGMRLLVYRVGYNPARPVGDG